MEVWKWELETTENKIEMPKGAEVLTVQAQQGIPCIWALVDPSQEKETRNFWIFGTGHSISSRLNMRYIGTFQTPQGMFVFHVFEEL